MQEMQDSLGWEDPWAVGSIPGLGRSSGVESGNHPSSLAWKIPWT